METKEVVKSKSEFVPRAQRESGSSRNKTHLHERERDDTQRTRRKVNKGGDEPNKKNHTNKKNTR